MGGTSYLGGNGGSGLIILRIKQITSPTSISSLELIRGSTTDSYNDYKIINNGDFKITSTTTSSDVDRFVINSAGNITIAGTLDGFR